MLPRHFHRSDGRLYIHGWHIHGWDVRWNIDGFVLIHRGIGLVSGKWQLMDLEGHLFCSE
jgi:hypothetical protein